jgi:hypothetical protein
MFKKLFRNWLLSDRERGEEKCQDVSPMAHSVVDALMRDTPTAILAIPISNGYILRVDGRNGHNLGTYAQSTLIYAADEKGVADEIVAHQARVKIGINQPQQGEMFKAARMGGASQSSPNKGI